MALDDFIRDNKVTMTWADADSNPFMGDDRNSMNHYKVTIKHDGRQYTTWFSKGSGYNGNPPDVMEVLECLVSDCSVLDSSGGGFLDWCNEYGYSDDSIKALRTYETIQNQAKRLEKLFGRELYETLL